MLKHNKKKNSKIVYEQLMVLASRLFLSGKKDEGNYILEIIKSHFSPQTMLGKEKKVFDSLLDSKNKKEQEADAILTECLSEVRLIDQRKLESEKINLINRVFSDIGKDLFSIPIKEYKLLASIQILFNEMRNNFKYSTPTERVQMKKTITENMKLENKKNEELEIDNFTYNLVIKKFNDRYSALLNEDQREILSEWINFLVSDNRQKLLKILTEKRNKIKGRIDYSLIKENHKNSDYFDSLKEARQNLSKPLEENSINEDFIYETMRYLDLVDDLDEIVINNEKR